MNKNILTKITINLLLLVFVIVWVLPTFGLFVSSFRDKDLLATSGWWTTFKTNQVNEIYRTKTFENQFEKDGVFFIKGNLLDENSTCVFSLMGHHAINYMPQNKTFGEDYNYLKFPSINYSNMVVGIGDTVSLLNDNPSSMEVYAEIVSATFGETWASKIDSQYVSPRTDFDISKYKNEFAKKEYIQIKDSLSMNLFRYDGSMLMKNGTGKKILWTTLRDFITQSNNYLEQVTEEIDVRIKRELSES